MRRLLCLLVAVSALAAPAPRAMAVDPLQGFLGRPLAAATESGFFKWFSLAEVASAAGADGGRMLSYRPSGPRFHRLVLVELTLSAGGDIRRMDLVLLRSFIASLADAPFARDIAKSFLHAVPGAADEAALLPIANEIEYRRAPAEGTVIVGPGYHPPPLPKTPSVAYETYIGRNQDFAATLRRARLEMRNAPATDGKVLRIAFVAAGPARP